MKNYPNHIQGLIYATLGALALTPDGLLVRLVNVDDWAIVFWRGFLIATCIFLIQLLQYKDKIFRKFPPQNLKEWGAAVLAAIGAVCFVLAITHTTVANVLVILCSMSFFAAILSVVSLKERIAKRTVIAMVSATFGIIIVFIEDINGTGMSGKLFALACAFVTAANMTLIRSDKSINVPSVFAWGGLMAAVPGLLFAHNLATDFTTSMTFLTMAGLNAIAFVLLGVGAKRIPSSEVTLLMLLETIIGPMWVWLIINEEPSANALIGGVIVISTLVLHSFASLKANRA